jgi:UDP-2,3-diacylglucosamine pyrophosphatase LpxH
MIQKRELEVCILSDTHLGSKGCDAQALIQYLNSINPELLILNGDTIDIWAFTKSKFNSAHSMIISRIFKMIEEGSKVIYITGNHDEALRRFSDISLGGITLVDKYILNIEGEKHWIFHGDIFDRTTKGNARLLAKLGGIGYDILIVINRWVNQLFSLFGKQKLSLSKKIKKSVKSAVKWISNFESIAIELAIEQGYDYVVCGHIHEPKIQQVTTSRGSVFYMNSGDWVENLSSLEYYQNKWHLYFHKEGVNSEPTKDPFSLQNHNDSLIIDIIKDFDADKKKTALKIMFGKKNQYSSKHIPKSTKQ